MNFLHARAPQIDAARGRPFCRLTQIAGKDDAIARGARSAHQRKIACGDEQLSEIYATLTALGLAENFDIDFGDAGGLEYYTG